MATVHTAFGTGEIVKTETVRGRTQHLVNGPGFKVWCNAEDVRTAEGPGNLFSVQFEPGQYPGKKRKDLDPELFGGHLAATTIEPATDVNKDNSTTLPYNPSPQYPVEMFSQDANIQPGENEIDADKRLRPADSRTFDKSKGSPWPGPDPKLFVKGAGGPGLVQHTHGTDYAEPGGHDEYDHDEWPGDYPQGHWRPHTHNPNPHLAEHIDPADVDPEYLEHGHPISHSLDQEGGSHYLGYYRPAGLSDKYIRLAALEDPDSPVSRWRRDPVQFLYAHAYAVADPHDDMHISDYGRLVQADVMLREAAWTDVRNKALRLRSEGRVSVYDTSPNGIYARVEGDDGTYDTMIVKSAGQSIADWHCDCDWGRYAFKNQMTHVGRLCSHGYAAYLELQGKSSRRIAGVVDDFKKYVRDSNDGHVDQACADNFISLSEDPLSDEDVDSLYSYVDNNRATKEERDYKQADVLRTIPRSLTPDLVVVPDGADSKFVDVTKDDRKTTGPGQITKGSKIDSRWVDHAQVKYDDHEPIARFSGRADEHPEEFPYEHLKPGEDPFANRPHFNKQEVDRGHADHGQDIEPQYTASFTHVDAMGNGYSPESLWRTADGGVFGDIPAVPAGTSGTPVESGPSGGFLPGGGPRGGTSPVPTGQELARGNSPIGGAGSGNPLSDFAPAAPGELTGHGHEAALRMQAYPYDPNDKRDIHGTPPAVAPVTTPTPVSPSGGREPERGTPAHVDMGPPNRINDPTAPAGGNAPSAPVAQAAGTAQTPPGVGGGGGGGRVDTQWQPNADASHIGPGTYDVVKGDTASSIAERAGLGGGYQELAKDNPGNIGTSGTNLGTNPNLIHPGDQFNIPGAGGAPHAGTDPAPGPAPGVAGLDAVASKIGSRHYADAYTTYDTNPGTHYDDPNKKKDQPAAPAPAPAALPPGMDPGHSSNSSSGSGGSGHGGGGGSRGGGGSTSDWHGTSQAYGPNSSAYDPMAEPGSGGRGSSGGGGGFNPSMISDVISPITNVVGDVMGGLGGFAGGLGGLFHGSLTYVADHQLLDKLRDLSAEEPPLGDMDYHNDEVRGVVEELRERGYDADQLVAMVRHADRDEDPGGSFGRPGGGDWADLPFAGSGPDPKLWYSTSEDYLEGNDYEDVTSGKGDTTNYTKPGQGPRQKASVRRQSESERAPDVGSGGGQPIGPAGEGWFAGSGVGPASAAGTVNMGHGLSGDLDVVGPITTEVTGSYDNFYHRDKDVYGRPFGLTPEQVDHQFGAGGLPSNLTPEKVDRMRRQRMHGADTRSLPEPGLREPMQSNYGDPNQGAGPGDSVSSESKWEGTRTAGDGSDIVRQFHASGGGALAVENTGGGSGGYSDAAIADQAQHFLKTAGRHFSLAEQRELEAEFHPLGARNLPTEEDLAGTHYLD